MTREEATSFLKERINPNIVETVLAAGGSDKPSIELNIAYGESAPEDTSKIWVKADEPENLAIKYGKTSSSGTEYINYIGNFPTSSNTRDGKYCGFVKVKDEIWSYASYSDNKATFNIWNTKTNTYTTKTINGSTVSGNRFANGLCYDGKNTIYTMDWLYPKTHVLAINIENGTYSSVYSTDSNVGGNCMATYINDNAYFISGPSITKYNPSSKKLTKLSLTLPKEVTTFGVVENKIYLFGDSTSGNNHDVYIFDTETDSYTTISNVISSNIWRPSKYCGIFDQIIYIFGTGNSSDGKVITKFDTNTNTSTIISLQMPGIDSYVHAETFNDFVLLHYNDKIYYFTKDWDLIKDNGEIYLSSDDGYSKGYIINTETLKQEVNSAKYFYGDSNNKATSAPVYYHNGTDWVEFT